MESCRTPGRGSSGFIDVLKKAGVHFRNKMETGPGGKQIQVEDPDGNPIELFEPARRAELESVHHPHGCILFPPQFAAKA